MKYNHSTQDPPTNQTFAYKSRNIRGIRVNHTYIPDDGVNSYICSLKTNNHLFVLDYINEIFQCAFGKQNKYTMRPIYINISKSHFISGIVYNINGNKYGLNGFYDSNNGIILKYSDI
jgi:hypothetical protein